MNAFFKAALLKKNFKVLWKFGPTHLVKTCCQRDLLDVRTRAWYQTVKLSSAQVVDFMKISKSVELSLGGLRQFAPFLTFRSLYPEYPALSCLVVFQKDKGQLLAFGDCPSFVTRFRNWMKMCVYVCLLSAHQSGFIVSSSSSIVSFDNCLQL